MFHQVVILGSGFSREIDAIHPLRKVHGRKIRSKGSIAPPVSRFEATSGFGTMRMTYVANISVERADDSFRAVLRFSLPVLRNSIRFLITIALVFFVSFYANSWGMLIFMVVASGVFIPIFYLAAWEAREEVVASFLNAYKELNQPAQTTPVSAPR